MPDGLGAASNGLRRWPSRRYCIAAGASRDNSERRYDVANTRRLVPSGRPSRTRGAGRSRPRPESQLNCARVCSGSSVRASPAECGCYDDCGHHGAGAVRSAQAPSGIAWADFPLGTVDALRQGARGKRPDADVVKFLYSSARRCIMAHRGNGSGGDQDEGPADPDHGADQG